jgi:hypothetical protein
MIYVFFEVHVEHVRVIVTLLDFFFVDVTVTVHLILDRKAHPLVVYYRPPLIESLATMYARYGPITRHGAVAMIGLIDVSSGSMSLVDDGGGNCDVRQNEHQSKP